MKILCAISALCCLAAATPLFDRSAAVAPRDLAPRSRNISPYSSSMKRKKTHHPHPLLPKRQAQGESEIIDVGQVRFLTDITFGDQTFPAILDSGSSDTWLIQTGFTCLDTSTGAEVDESQCNFGGTWTPDDTFTVYDNVNIKSAYGSGDRYVAGPLGYIDVTIAGLTVPSQTVGAPNIAAWEGNGEEVGLIGMAFPALTDEYTGTDPSQDQPGAQSTYDSLFQTMFVDDTFTPALYPCFALAISRDESGTGYGGAFVIGGIPEPTDPTVNCSDSSPVSAPLVVYGSGSAYNFYAINVDQIWSAGETYDAGVTVVVDSGAPTLAMPADAADAFNGAWSPAGQTDSYGNFVVDCNATPASFCIGIGGEWLCINPLDLVVDLGENTCISAVSAVSDASSGIYLVGDPFLKNVLAVYDWETYSMEFYARQYYQS